jgi:hypothetical protein
MMSFTMTPEVSRTFSIGGGKRKERRTKGLRNLPLEGRLIVARHFSGGRAEERMRVPSPCLKLGCESYG